MANARLHGACPRPDRKYNVDMYTEPYTRAIMLKLSRADKVACNTLFGVLLSYSQESLDGSPSQHRVMIWTEERQFQISDGSRIIHPLRCSE